MHSSVEPILNMRLVFDLIHITMQYCNFKMIPILIMLLIKTSTGKKNVKYTNVNHSV